MAIPMITVFLGLTTAFLVLIIFTLDKKAADLMRDLALARSDAALARNELSVERRERDAIGVSLRTCNDFSETVLNSINDAVSVINAETFQISDVNSVFERTYNLRKEEIVGKTCYEITHRRTTPCEPPDHVCPLVETMKTKESKTVVHEHPDDDGGIRYEEVATYPIRNREGMVVHVSRDVSLQKNTESELQTAHKALSLTVSEIEKERASLAGALDEISLLIQRVITERDTSIRFRNPNLRKCHDVMLCDNDNCLCFGKEAMRCWQVAGTYCNCRQQGTFASKLDSCLECSVFKFATENPIYLIGEHFNNMMHMLEMQNKELQGALDELQSAQAKILQQEKMASIGQLAAGVAHEINNPTGFIISNLGSLRKYTGKVFEFMKAQSEALDPLIAESSDGGRIRDELESRRKALKIDYVLEDLGNMISETVDGAERIKKIVQNLKSFSRQDNAEAELADLNAGIESTISIVWNELKYKANVVKEYGDIPPTRCNPGELNQVFMNLLVNAAQAIEKQGDITVKTWRNNGSIMVSIADTGAGIPKENLSKIFDPFYTTKEVGKGTGLGLSIAYDIVHKHNGDITVASEPDKGTTFTVKIPVVEG